MKKTLALCLILLLACQGCLHRVVDGRVEREEMASVVLIERTDSGVEMSLDPKLEGKVQPTEEHHWKGAGTGSVVAHTPDGKSVILTAAHVVAKHLVQQNEAKTKIRLIMDTSFVVKTHDGQTCKALTIKENDAMDLALMVADCDAGKNLDYTDEPPVASPIQIVGCPDGFYSLGNFFVMDGRWIDHMLVKESDDEKIDLVALSVPVYYGASGSPILWHGKLVGVLSRMNGDYNQMAFAVGIRDVQKFVEGK